MPRNDELRQQIVAAARGYCGVAYSHQAFSGARMDCRGLPLRVGRTLNLVNANAEFNNYGRQPNPERLRAALREHLVEIPIAAAQDGDVLLLREHGVARHLAVRSSMTSGGESWPTVIHACNIKGTVVEHRLDERLAGQIDSAWSYSDLAPEGA